MNSDVTKYQIEYYDKGEYSSIQPYIKRKLEIIIGYVKSFNNIIVADIGCYTGEVTAQFKALKAKAIGIDISFSSLLKAKAKDINVLRADMSSIIPLRDESTDLVYCSEVIEHLMDTDKFLIEIKRILKPGGILFLTTPNIAALKNRIRILFGKYPYNLEYKLGGAGHVHLYNKAKLREQLEGHGLMIIRFYGINIIPWKYCQKSKIVYRLNSLISNPLSSLCLNMAVIGKKQN